MNRLIPAVAIPALMVLIGLWAWDGVHRGQAPEAGTLDLADLLGEGDDGFEPARGTWSFRFPADHGAHTEFRSEVWSINGQMLAEGGQRLGFQLVFLRLALTPEPKKRESAWAADQIYRAHFALTDEAGDRFTTEERFSRAALGLSGSTDDPAGVWLEDWSLAADGRGGLRLRTRAKGRSLALDLVPGKPMLREGQVEPSGLGMGAGAGFHFYLMSRLSLSGTLESDGVPLSVTGYAWFDRAWGDVPVPRGQVALDRFALQLDDGRDLLCLRLRRRDGSGTPIPSCLLIGVDGSVETFRRRDIRLEPDGVWRSPVDGTVYPAAWRLRLPLLGLDLAVNPLVQDQELNFALRVWSGSVSVDGMDRSGTVTGRGFLELTGYSEATVAHAR